jgi:Uma2 family endonuclease
MRTVEEDLALGPELAGALLTPKEFDAAEIADELYVYELINGVLVVSPPPSEEERGPNELLAYLLRCYQDRHPKGRALDYTLPEHLVKVKGNRRRADRVIWAGLGRLPKIRRDQPAIVIEHVSKGRRNLKRDYEAKRAEYLQAGIAEYWIIDRFRRVMTVHRGPADQPRKRIVKEGETYATSLLPGFKLPLARLFEEADRLREAQEQGKDR